MTAPENANLSKSDLRDELQALRRRVAALEAGQEVCNEGLLVLDEAGKIVSSNTTARRLLGIDERTEMIEWVGEDDQTLNREASPTALLKKNTSFRHHLFRTKQADNELIVSGKEVKDAEGNPLFALRLETPEQNTETPFMDAYRILGEHVPFPMVLTDMQAKIRYINPAGADLMGFDREKLENQPRSVAQSTAQEDRELDARAFRQLHEQGWCEPYERDFFTDDGQRHSALIAGLRINEPSSEDPTLVLLGLETTKWRQTEIKERKNQALFQHVFQMAREGMAILEINTKQIHINQEGRRILNLESEFEINYPFSDEYPFEILDESGKPMLPEDYPLSRAARGETIQDGHATLHYPNSSRVKHVNFDATAIRDAEGKPEYALLTMRDISRRQESEEALRKSEERFRRMVENGPFGFCLAAENGKILYANSTMEYITGRTLNEMRSPEFHWKEMVPKESSKNQRKAQEELLKYGQSHPIEDYVLRPDGTRFPVLVCQTILDHQPDLGAIAGISMVDMSQVIDARE
ncbi:MAG: PAS domain S-box protein, partial [Candidatus Sumerlaeota bacterium]